MKYLISKKKLRKLKNVHIKKRKKQDDKIYLLKSSNSDDQISSNSDDQISSNYRDSPEILYQGYNQILEQLNQTDQILPVELIELISTHREQILQILKDRKNVYLDEMCCTDARQIHLFNQLIDLIKQLD